MHGSRTPQAGGKARRGAACGRSRSVPSYPRSLRDSDAPCNTHRGPIFRPFFGKVTVHRIYIAALRYEAPGVTLAGGGGGAAALAPGLTLAGGGGVATTTLSRRTVLMTTAPGVTLTGGGERYRWCIHGR